MTIEDFWNDMLSEEPARVRKAWLELDDEAADALLKHLRKMSNEDGWTAPQRQSASTALKIIRALVD
jgi:hypothetical protein